MKLSRMMFAVAVLASGSSAFAQGLPADRIGLSAGASATVANLTIAVSNLCVAAGGLPISAAQNLFGAGTNFLTYVCSTSVVNAGNYATTPTGNFRNFTTNPNIAELRLNVNDGSFSALQQINGDAITYRNPADGTVSAANGVAPRKRLGGLLDVQPGTWDVPTQGLVSPNTLALAGAGTPAGIGQTFGLAVSRDLYNALFADQFAGAGNPATVAKPIPGNTAPACTNNDSGRMECVPTVSKGQMAAIMADSGAFTTASINGANFLAPSLPAGTELKYARRVNTSGTQAAAQAYFLGLNCNAVPLSIVAQGASGTTAASGTLNGAIRVYGLGSTGNVRTVLNLPTPNYAIAVMSGENNQAESWRWVKVQGAPIGENAAPSSAGITNSATLVNGSYDFYFESVYAGGSTDGNNFWGTVTGQLNTLAAPVGLVNSTQLSGGFNKGGASCSSNTNTGS